MTLNLTQAFARFDADVENIRYSVSAFSSDGHLIIVPWQHYFGRPVNGVLPYYDRLSRWEGKRGNDLLRQHLERAIEESSPIKAIVAQTNNREAVDSGKDASKIKKEFHFLEGKIGRVVEFDGDRFVLHFTREDA